MTYTFPLTRERLEAKRQAIAQQYGIQIQGDSGSIDQWGVTAALQYDATSQILTVDVEDKPFFVSWDRVQNTLQSALGGN